MMGLTINTKGVFGMNRISATLPFRQAPHFAAVDQSKTVHCKPIHYLDGEHDQETSDTVRMNGEGSESGGVFGEYKAHVFNGGKRYSIPYVQFYTYVMGQKMKVSISFTQKSLDIKKQDPKKQMKVALLTVECRQNPDLAKEYTPLSDFGQALYHQYFPAFFKEAVRLLTERDRFLKRSSSFHPSFPERVSGLLRHLAQQLVHSS
jgi:hypothetical protein